MTRRRLRGEVRRRRDDGGGHSSSVELNRLSAPAATCQSLLIQAATELTHGPANIPSF
jgi:hypothetical protein